MLQSSLLWCIAAAVLIAGVACVHAARCAARCSKLTSGLSRITKDAANCLIALDEVRETLVTLQDRHETLRARVGMRETRAARRAPENDLQGAAWKEAKRKELGIGVVKPREQTS